MAEAPLVYSVVLNWNRAELTLKCVRSLDAMDYPRHRAIVVDNASTDDSLDFIRKAWPKGEVIANSANEGFGPGMNAGIRAALCAGADYVWVLNNDLVVEPDALKALVDAAEEQPEFGVLSPKVLRGDDSNVVWYAGGSFNPRLAQVKRFGADVEDSGWPRVPQEVSFAPGCSLLLRRELIESVGLFDETYFLYWDDVEYCDRLRRNGKRILYVPQARIHHSIGGSGDEPGGNSVLFDYYNTRNLFWFLRQRSHGIDRALAEAFNLSYLGLRAARVLTKEQRKREKLSALARGIRDGHVSPVPTEKPPTVSMAPIARGRR